MLMLDIDGQVEQILVCVDYVLDEGQLGLWVRWLGQLGEFVGELGYLWQCDWVCLDQGGDYGLEEGEGVRGRQSEEFGEMDE